ncbi:bifunctional apoptosis regulator [Labeo rohita]|uniref:Bifunctional apoptosis regulator n=1 Tax=Labeo rohita TaxID=84645 RepID=A0A498MAL5_LABRO|nr:bifunctional apoptosis regulator [Labeo rohita]
MYFLLPYQLLAVFAWQWMSVHYWTAGIITVHAMLLTVLDVCFYWTLWKRGQMRTLPKLFWLQMFAVLFNTSVFVLPWPLVPLFIINIEIYVQLRRKSQRSSSADPSCESLQSDRSVSLSSKFSDEAVTSDTSDYKNPSFATLVSTCRNKWEQSPVGCFAVTEHVETLRLKPLQSFHEPDQVSSDTRPGGSTGIKKIRYLGLDNAISETVSLFKALYQFLSMDKESSESSDLSGKPVASDPRVFKDGQTVQLRQDSSKPWEQSPVGCFAVTEHVETFRLKPLQGFHEPKQALYQFLRMDEESSEKHNSVSLKSDGLTSQLPDLSDEPVAFDPSSVSVLSESPDIGVEALYQFLRMDEESSEKHNSVSLKSDGLTSQLPDLSDEPVAFDPR